MEETMSEIDNFERRLELKTLQEGLKHKAASTDITPHVMFESMGGGMADFTERVQFDMETLRMARGYTEEDENEMSREEHNSSGYAEDDDEESPHGAEPSTRGTLYVKQVPLPVVNERRLVVKLLHASNLKGPELSWRTGARALVCNPYCVVRHGMEMCTGKVIRSSRNPVFHDSFVFHAPLEGSVGDVVIEVFCHEGEGKPSTFVGSATIQVDALEDLIPNQGLHKWLDLVGGQGGCIHYEITLTHVHEK